eukprot:CAMPEP_0182920132 /NCGR_PEP_ID=MMETSP0105_2-20130417/3243_1 /TAXON_ID=81532 ORGANISM="Acanthoeca-like sp., Strain 10tr" /NCGR_SAMPLE_ID=MMETSP0105_2 /ASSEMBLY_ACC=CAM_ASM_000205 /LENGTH=116 /DNA_ID=CAMNT_0025057475 /DNA_START=299 /DNA_END=649 /DNA_ORIENTATION=+
MCVALRDEELISRRQRNAAGSIWHAEHPPPLDHLRQRVSRVYVARLRAVCCEKMEAAAACLPQRAVGVQHALIEVQFRQQLLAHTGKVSRCPSIQRGRGCGSHTARHRGDKHDGVP